MKLYKNGVMYVQLEDILHVGVVPREVGDELADETLEAGRLIDFTTKNAISFWKGKREILDYSTVKNLTDEIIIEKIQDLNNELKKLSERNNAQSSSFRILREKENEINARIKNLQYILETLRQYIENRDKYDCMFKQLI